MEVIALAVCYSGVENLQLQSILSIAIPTVLNALTVTTTPRGWW
jgi:hypothetical protein